MTEYILLLISCSNSKVIFLTDFFVLKSLFGVEAESIVGGRSVSKSSLRYIALKVRDKVGDKENHLNLRLEFLLNSKSKPT